MQQMLMKQTMEAAPTQSPLKEKIVAASEEAEQLSKEEVVELNKPLTREEEQERIQKLFLQPFPVRSRKRRSFM